ncbi:MAG: ABC transporter permease [Bacilli bacterium]|nr:ABC transporter permease [Bacilli bacterium]
MMNKFRFLTRESIGKKINTKSFKIINIVLFIIIVCVINLDSVVKFFGGDFDEPINIYVVDEVGIYDDFNEVMGNSYLEALKTYNAKVEKSDKSFDELKEEIIKEEKKDIIIKFTPVENPTYENVFNVDFASYEYVDTILYQNISSAVNTTKVNEAMKLANIDKELLEQIYKGVELNRIILNEDVKEDEEFMELIGAVITIAFIVPFFLLITLIVQMIGAEINEEKSSKSMEIIISSVSPEAHFMSKLISSNVFAIVQGALLLLYGLIGSVIRVFTSSGINTAVNDAMANNPDSIGKINEYINLFLKSDVCSKLLSGIPLFIIIILLSFLAYSLFIGVLASVTTNMEDYNQIQTPVMVFLMLGYFLAIYASVYQGSSFITVMAYVPFISGILAPVMYTLGEMTLGGLLIAAGLLVIVIFLLYKYGLKVYKVGILNYSSSKLWSKIFKALKS